MKTTSLSNIPRVILSLLTVWMSATSAVEVIPGLNLVSNNVTCCPTLPLVGPAWKIDLTTSTILDDSISARTCSFFPRVDRSMVVVFQPNGNINGWGDHEACQPFQGSYQVSSLVEDEDPAKISNPLNRYRHAFRWNQWKTQPFSTCKYECDEQVMAWFWSQLSSTVTTLVVTGATNMELQNTRGKTVVRLEAVPDSYSCREESFVCDINNAPVDLGLSATALRDYLAFGDNGDNTLDHDSSASSHLLPLSTTSGFLLSALILVGTVIISS